MRNDYEHDTGKHVTVLSHHWASAHYDCMLQDIIAYNHVAYNRLAYNRLNSRQSPQTTFGLVCAKNIGAPPDAIHA